jgi:outer membrane lipoprotein SlyB
MNEMIHTNKTATAATGPRPIVWAAIGAVGALSLALAGLGFSKVMNRSANNTPTQAPTITTQTESAPAMPPAALTSPPKALAQQTTKPAVNHSQTNSRSTQAPATGARYPSAPAQVAQAVNPNLGTVQSVRAIQQKGEGTGAGAVIGGVLGGVLGHQVGGGTGKDLATVGGAVGGGVLGHQIERNVRGKTVYEVTVRMDNGSLRTFTQSTATAVGSRVFAEGSSLRGA